MRGKVVTVFGGAGFIGRHVVRRLAARGAVIRVATRDPDRAIDLKPAGEVGQIVPITCTVDDDRRIALALAGADLAVNLIGILYESRAGDFDRVQGAFPGKVGNAAAAAGVERVVQLSAIGADAGSPSLYARSKAAGEAALRAVRPDAVILRPSIVFGAGDGFFERFGAMATKLPFLPLIGGGTTKFQPVYVGDVAAAVEAGLTREDAVGRTFELGGPRVASFAELLRYILQVTGRRRMLIDLPNGIARLQARILERLPSPPMTTDQLKLLERDNVVAPGAATLADLGIAATPMEAIVPTYLARYARTQALPAA